APNVEPKIKLLICKAGVFEDLAQILEGNWASFTGEVVCTLVDGLLKDNKEGLEHVLTSKMINGLKKVLSIDHSKIKRVHIAALARVVICGNDEQRDELYKMNVLPSLVSQFAHPDKHVVDDAVVAMNNLVLIANLKTAMNDLDGANVVGKYEKLKWFGAPDLMDIQYTHILLAAAKYCDPTRSLFKLALDLMRKEAPNVEPKIKLLICKAGVFEDLAQILEGNWAV
ncbi:MAG: hypothetical protein EZS28_047312, partial [Streblomastix strix]